MVSLLLLTTILVSVGAFGSTGAYAQAAPAAPANQAVDFSIPAQPLSSAINSFIRATGWQISYSSQLARGKTSAAVVGAMPPAQALQRLVAGTGVGVRIGGPGSAALIDPSGAASGAVSGAISLDTIDVQGDSTVGYLATRSSAGTKTDTPLIETPQTINVVTRQQISDQNAQSITEALRYTPGVVAEPYGGIGTTSGPLVLIRGFSADGAAFYLNGLKQLAPVGIDPYLLDRIDVIKGPASVLYGQSSPGGLIDVTSKLPTGETFREVEFLVGDPRRIQAAFDFSGVANADRTILYRVAGVGFDARTDVDFQQKQRIAIAPSFSWRPTADTNLTLYGIYQHDPKLALYNSLPASGTILPNINGRISRNVAIGEPNFNNNQTTNARIGYSLEQRLTEQVKFHSAASYSVVDTDVLPFGIMSISLDGRTANRYLSHQLFKYDTITTDNRLQFDTATGPISHKILVGTDYQWQTYDLSYGYNFSIPSLDLFNPIYTGNLAIPAIDTRTRQKSEQIGVYVQDQIKLERLSVVVGGRYDWASSTTSDRNANIVTADQSDKAFTWRTSLIYQFDNGVAPYASYSTSFQPQAGVDASLNPFKPTTGQQYEAGLKYQPLGQNSFVTISAFQITQQNRLTTDSSNPNFQTQLGEMRSRGIEVSANMQITEAFNLLGGYTFNEAVITKSNNGDIGNAPTAMPRNMASLWGFYKIQGGQFSGVGFGLGARYVGSTYGDAANSFMVPSYTLVDAALQYDVSALGKQWEGLKLSLNVSNLFDKTYVPGCVFDNFCSYGAGRSVSARLTYRW